MPELDRTSLPIRRPTFQGVTNRTLRGSEPDWDLIGHPVPPDGAPNVLLHGVDMAFAVRGESFLPLLDALLDRPQLRLISCRHEAGAAVMAEASAKLTGRPGVCLSRGPGACHATIGRTRLPGCDAALAPGRPGAAVVSQREAQQEIEYRTMFGPLREMGGGDQPGRTHSGTRASCVSRCCIGSSWTRRAGAAGRHPRGSNGCRRLPARAARARSSRPRRARRGA